MPVKTRAIVKAEFYLKLHSIPFIQIAKLKRVLRELPRAIRKFKIRYKQMKLRNLLHLQHAKKFKLVNTISSFYHRNENNMPFYQRNTLASFHYFHIHLNKQIKESFVHQ